MASGTQDSVATGENIIIAGLIVQILFFSCFVVASGVFHYRLWRSPTPRSLDQRGLWQKSMFSLYAGSFLIWVRCTFRLIEYTQGNDGYLVSHEAYLYIFDATLMIGVMILFAIVHPRQINDQLQRAFGSKLGEDESVYPMV